MMDLVLRLRELRREAGLTQKDVATLSGLGNRTISTFETGRRLGSMKLSQLEKLLKVYHIPMSAFFSSRIEQRFDPSARPDLREDVEQIAESLSELPAAMQRTLLVRFARMIQASTEAERIHHQRRPAYQDLSREWEMMTSRN